MARAQFEERISVPEVRVRFLWAGDEYINVDHIQCIAIHHYRKAWQVVARTPYGDSPHFYTIFESKVRDEADRYRDTFVSWLQDDTPGIWRADEAAH
jgi:hypothetical protein